MDDKRRTRLREAIKMLDSALSIVDAVCDQEQECIDNYPENLQGTERFERMENAVDDMSEAADRIGEAVDSIQSAIG